MSGFGTDDSGSLRVELNEIEHTLVANLAGQLIGVLDAAAELNDTDPALRRLLPDAYPGDAQASAEFRRYTADELVAGKVQDARTVIGTIERASGDPALVVLDDGEAQAWLHTLTNLRLTLAARLGIEHDGDDGRTDEDAMPMQQVYFWLGYLQETLIEALTG